MDYNKIYEQLIEKRKINPVTEGYKENHHILPRSMGGDNSKENLVYLTGREHWVAHLLLHKIHRCSQTTYACHMMAMRCEERGIPQIRSSRTYEWIRIQHARHVSNMGKKRVGDKNGSFGTMWISNIELKENKKIKKDEEIPDGWVKGRGKWKSEQSVCNSCGITFSPCKSKQICCSKKCSNKYRANIASKKEKSITKELLEKKALLYTTRTDFIMGCHNYYNIAKKRGILDEICSHMEIKKKKWTKELCHKEAIKYQTRTEFQNESNRAYAAARRRKWLNDICDHMIKRKIRGKKWTKESCHKEAIKYQTRTEFQNESNGAYTAACRYGWLEDICSHMAVLVKPKGYWSKSNCEKEAKKYVNKSEFRINSGTAYVKSKKNKWLDEFYS